MGWLRTSPARLRALAAALVVLGAAVVVLATRGASPRPSVTLQPSPLPRASSTPPPGPPSPTPPASPPGCPAPPAGGFPDTGVLTADYPTALAWSPDGRLFWAERGGAIKVWEGGAAHTFAIVSTVTVEPGGAYSERGLLGLAIHDHFVYAFFSNTDYATQSIVRWTDCGGANQDLTVIAADIPAGGDCCHKGGRLAIDPRDGALFATVGDNHHHETAQAPGDLRGKVIRFAPGGGRSIWTSGLRNPFGIAFAPDGTLALTNNGPSTDAGTPCGACGDEVYVVGTSSGVDYQWPFCWGYGHPFGGSGDCHGLPGPQYSTEGGPYAKSNPWFVAPSGMTWVSSGQLAGHFVFCAYSDHHLYEYLGQASVADTGMTGCALDVKQGPDGALYTSDQGAIHRH